MESLTSDLLGLKTDILEHLEHLEEWAADEPVKSAGFIMGRLGKARVRKEPLGVVLVIGAWNFPFLLTLQPVIAAIAAGCCVLIKPSELSGASQDLMADLVSQYLDPEAIRLVTGGPQETTGLLELKFNHIFFTGSSKVARYVSAAAAKHLTPTVLELGGQGPAIVTSKADVDLAAKCIAWAKFLNAGQICLSVNHVFVDPSIHDVFVQRLVYWTNKFSSSGHMCKIVNTRNFDRLAKLLDESKGNVHQVKVDEENNMMSPAVVTDVDMDDSLLSEELFGPICPVIRGTYKDAVRKIKRQGDALIFFDNTTSGGVTINDVLMHYAVPGAPFGGVGESGMGYYHGKYGFNAFTHQRTIVEIPSWLHRLTGARYPPYDIGNKGKVTVKNHLGFRRGESMEDQTVGGSNRWAKAGILTLAVAVALYRWNSVETALSWISRGLGR
ncbi:hypothetical protein LCI18_012193 [Fusarium solani-melongenae]|uniref:Uncharacterized protein n=1 Tax=Fusarium solani subsp. cucurbitae TaxID=2747967 RepID=A0ACD3ZIX2_FUSSC|nr:hypothetical protein LCI18_012193 [Fusarium solani-melongenae]